MSILERASDVAIRADPPCVVCNTPALSVVWGHRLCDECFDSLQAAEAFTEESIAAADATGFCAEARRRTSEWVATRRKERRR